MIKKIPKNCSFYTVQEIPGIIKPTNGPFDLRKNINKLLGNCNFKNKKILELGPASGYITFYLESLGAKMTTGNPSSINASGPCFISPAG